MIVGNFLISHDDELKILMQKDPLPGIAIPSRGAGGKGGRRE